MNNWNLCLCIQIRSIETTASNGVYFFINKIKIHIIMLVNSTYYPKKDLANL
jgi:hypothetical protein